MLLMWSGGLAAVIVLSQAQVYLQCPRNCICQKKQCMSCKENHYSPGSGCFWTCSISCKEKKCDGVTGYCTHGCKDGWYGSGCNQLCTGFCKRCNRETGLCETGSEKDGGSFLLSSKMFGVVAGVFGFLCICALVFKCLKKQNTRSEYRDDCNDLEMRPSTQTQLHHSQDSVPSEPVWHSRSYVMDADTPGRGVEQEQGENEAIAQHSTPLQPAFQEPTAPPYPAAAHQPYQEPTHPRNREPAHQPFQEPTHPRNREPTQSPAHPAPSGPTASPPAYSSLFPNTSSKH